MTIILQKEKKRAYTSQKCNARYRGVKWKLSFKEWCDLWEDKWDQRGCCKGQYVMGRIGDTGPYSVENVRIITVEESLAEEHVVRRNTLRIKLSKKVRPEFRTLIKSFKNFDDLADFLGTSANNMAAMKKRGYMSIKFAKLTEELSDGKYKAKMLAKRGEI